jgi:hypothetical protein
MASTRRLQQGAGLAKDEREDMAAVAGLSEVPKGLAHARPQRLPCVPARARRQLSASYRSFQDP